MQETHSDLLHFQRKQTKQNLFIGEQLEFTANCNGLEIMQISSNPEHAQPTAIHPSETEH